MRNSTQLENVRRRASTSAELDEVMAIVEPECCDTAVLTSDDSAILQRHQLEREVRLRLMAEPSLNFTSLVVRRFRSGLCLEGVLETNDSETEVSQLVREICGVTQVLNRLVIHRPHQLPRKG
ncbi:MAG: hypothetical protein ACKV2Q_21400 [Planctomycetaceae bacterium]